MTQGYCVKCKEKQEFVNARDDVMRNGRRCIRGACAVCGTGMFKIRGLLEKPPAENVVIPIVSTPDSGSTRRTDSTT